VLGLLAPGPAAAVPAWHVHMSPCIPNTTQHHCHSATDTRLLCHGGPTRATHAVQSIVSVHGTLETTPTCTLLPARHGAFHA
jgi:hypothetical protein